MRRLLYVTPFSPIPPREGHRKRIDATLGMVESMGFEIDFLFLSLDHYWLVDAADRERRALRDRLANLHFVFGEAPSAPRLGEAYRLDEWMSEAFLDYARWLARLNNYDALFVNYIFLGRVAELFGPNVLKILDTHDRLGGRAELLRANRSPVEFFYTTREEEMHGLRRFDVVLAIKPEEGAYFRSVCNSTIIDLPYCEPTRCDPASRLRVPQQGEPVRFGVFGSSNHINVANLLAFLELYRRDPRARCGDRLSIEVYGSICDVLPTLDIPGVRSMGKVGAVDEFYRAIDCVLVPQSFSTGLKIKVAEAMAYGVPILSHRHALEGLFAPDAPEVGCDDLPALLDACYATARDRRALERNAVVVRTAQSALLDTVQAGRARIKNLLDTARPTLALVVDGAALGRSVLYRYALRSVASGLAVQVRLVVIIVGERPNAREGEFFRGWHLGECINAADATGALRLAREHGAARAYLALPAPAADRPDTLPIIELTDLAVLAAPDALAASGAPREDMPGVSHVRSRAWRGELGEGDASIWYYRWLPWELDFAGRFAGQTTRLGQLVFVDDHLSFGGGTGETVLCGCLDCAAASLDQLEHVMFSRLRVPDMVLDRTRDGVPFAVANELMRLNGVPIYARTFDPAQLLDACGVYDWNVALALDNATLRPSLSWERSGWAALPLLEHASPRQVHPITPRQSMSLPCVRPRPSSGPG